MRLLLINNNPAVSRLINLSAKKYGYEIEEFKSDDFDLNENYDVTITDNEAVSENSILLLRESGNLGDIIYIGPKGLPKPVYANYFLQKPFLPTDFIDMIKKIEKSKQEKEIKKEEAKIINEEDIESFIEHDENDMDDSGMIALDLDDLDSLDLPMPDDELYDEKDEEIDSEKKSEDLQEKSEEVPEKEDDVELDDIISESDVEQVVDELSEEELSVSEEPDDEDFELGTQDETFIEESPSILDSEDINEVKQLLIDNDEDEEEEIVEEEIEVDDEQVDKNNDTEDKEAQNDTEYSELVQEVEDMKKPEDILQEIESIHEENIEETEVPEVIEEETVDDIAMVEDNKEENIYEDTDTIGKEKSSIDDLMQEDLNDLFGEENPEEEKEVKSIDTEQLKEDLQTKIEDDVKKILNKDEIKEALKGLILNISISFDEEQK